MDVGQTLLHQSKHRQFHLPGQSAEFLRDIEANFQTAALYKALNIPTECRVQAVFVEQRGVQKVRGSANVAMQLLNHLLNSFGLSREFGCSAPSFLDQLCEVH